MSSKAHAIGKSCITVKRIGVRMPPGWPPPDVVVGGGGEGGGVEGVRYGGNKIAPDESLWPRGGW